MSTQPIIGITKPERGDNLAYTAMCLAVRLAGGVPIELSPGMAWRKLRLKGLLIGGGSDVFPAHYGQDAIEGARYDHDRDEMEMYWARRARDSHLPTLAICRGAQLMNVASGGSLHQRLAEIYQDVDYPSSALGHMLYRKTITIVEESLLSRLIQKPKTRVNSIHKQAIADLGEGLLVSACERNGVIQAIEDPAKPFYLGVQFHPEFMIYRKEFRAIFEGLVEAAKAY